MKHYVFLAFAIIWFLIPTNDYAQYFNRVYNDRPCEIPESKQSMVIDESGDIVYLSSHPDFYGAFVVNKVDNTGFPIASQKISVDGYLYATSIITSPDSGYIITGGYRGDVPSNWVMNAPYDYILYKAR